MLFRSLILNVDCDMYSNNSETIKDVLCFFMDEEKGHEFAFVQLPQHYNNITKNDLYGNSLLAISEVLEIGQILYDKEIITLQLEEISFGMKNEHNDLD